LSEKLTQFAYAHTIQAPLFILENFVLEFIEKLRLETEDHEMPSSRQSINMYKLLYARFMKKGRLTYEDLLEVAEVTSKLNNQFIARRLAWQILRYPHRRMPIATRRRKIPFFTDESERIDRGGTGGRMEKLPISKKESDKEVKKAYEKVLWLGNEYIQKLYNIKYLANICIILVLKKSLSQTYWLNVNDPSFPFVGIIEHTNFEPPETYQGRHIIYLSKYLPETDSLYSLSDEKLLEFIEETNQETWESATKKEDCYTVHMEK